MVRRLIVALLSLGCGLMSFACFETCSAQTVKLPQVPAVVENKVAAKVVQKLNSEYLLPASTKLWISIPNPQELEERFDATQFGELAKDPAIKPFVDSMRDQLKGWLKTQNVQLGLDLDDLHGIQSGEICVAGVLPKIGGGAAKGAHGIVLLIDVSKSRADAAKLQEKINGELVKGGAKQEKLEMQGVKYTKSTIKRNIRFRNNRSNYQAIIDGPGDKETASSWMLVSDNETIFREVLQRLANPKNIQKATTLAAQPKFAAVMKRTDLKPHKPQIRWMIDPFGYVELAKALEDENRPSSAPRPDDWASILKKQGLGAAQAIGGMVSVANGKHEILHRTFTYAPRDQTANNAKRMFDLFDFEPAKGKPLTPPSWVPADCSAYMTANWEFTKALGSIGYIYDAFVGEDESFKRLLNDFKVDPDMQLDIEKLVKLIDNRFTIVSATVEPISQSSERIVIGFPVTGSPDFIFESFKRAIPGSQVINLGGAKVLKVEAKKEEGDGSELTPFGGFGEEEDEEDDEEEEEFQLFAERYITVANGNLLVSNNKDYLKKLLAQKSSKLAKSVDYIEIDAALAQLTESEKVSWRQFGRTDKSMKLNYEMIRKGEMGNSETIMAKIINQIFEKQKADQAAQNGKEPDAETARKQKLDGSKLPADYEKSIAPYFGPMGWALETEKDGWRITGCVLKKKGMTEVVQKVSTPEDSSQR